MFDSVIRFLKRLKLKIKCKCGCLGDCEVDLNRTPSIQPVVEHIETPRQSPVLHRSPIQSPMLHRPPIPTPNEYVVVD